MATIQATYTIGNMDGVYSKVYDGTKLQANAVSYEGILDDDSFRWQITNDNIKHVANSPMTLECDDDYPQVWRNGVEVTDEYTLTQIQPAGTEQFVITARDITLQSSNLTKEYDGTALTGNGSTIDDITAGLTDRGYVSGEEFEYIFTGSQLFVGSSDNSFDVADSDTALTSDYSVTKQYGTLTVTGRTAPLTITVADQTKTYDGTAAIDTSDYTVAGELATGDTITVTLSNTNINVGTYADSIMASYKIMHNNGDGTSTDVTDAYLNVTVDAGDLTVNFSYDALVTITADSDSKLYDGSALTASGYTVTGALASGDCFGTVTVSGSITDAGTAANKVTSYAIFNQAGEDVTSSYTNIQTEDGILEVTKRSVTLTSASDSKPYDGTPLTNSNVVTTGDGFVGSEGLATSVATGSQTAVGTSKNTITYELNSNTKADNYDICTAQGDLTVTPAQFAITVGLSLTTGLTYLYDNTSTKVLTDGEYIASGLAQGDRVVNVTITTNSANAGIYDEDAYTLSYDIVNANGESVKASYVLSENKNDVEITKRTITIEADNASKVYDGTALTCHTYTVTEGSTEEYELLDGESVQGVGFTADSTITHAGSTANKVDASNVTITKADGSDSSMNYNILTEDSTLTVTQRGVLLQSTSAKKFYDGEALQNRQVVVTGFYYNEVGQVVVDSEGGFIDGDGCTYDFVNDNVVIDKDGNIIAWVVSEQSDTAYGQTEVGTSKNEFNYNNFTSVKAGSYESDYIIMYGENQESLGLGKDVQDLFGDLSVYGKVDVALTDYSWTYDYQAKTNGYFDDGYTVVVTTSEDGLQNQTTEIAHNSEGGEIPLLGNDTIVIGVTGAGGSAENGKVQHVGDDKKNTATYTIYRDGVDVTSEVEEYYQISIEGGTLSITPRTVEITSASTTKRYDGTELTTHAVTEGSDGTDKGFIYGEGAAYEVSGSQTEIGTSKNTFAISKLLTDTRVADYNFVMTEGDLVVTGGPASDFNYSAKSDIVQCDTATNEVYITSDNGQSGTGWTRTDTAVWGLSDWTLKESNYDFNGDSNADLLIAYEKEDGTADIAVLKNSYLEGGVIAFEHSDVRGFNSDWEYLGSADVNGDGITDILSLQTAASAGESDRSINAWILDANGAYTADVRVGGINNEWKVIGFGDVSGDGIENVVLQHQDGQVSYWAEAGSDMTMLQNVTDRTLLATGDFDGDGCADLLWKGNGDDTLWTWTGISQEDGLTDTRIGQISDLGDGWAFDRIGDFNGDGKDEILWSKADGTIAYGNANDTDFRTLTTVIA